LDQETMQHLQLMTCVTPRRIRSSPIYDPCDAATETIWDSRMTPMHAAAAPTEVASPLQPRKRVRLVTRCEPTCNCCGASLCLAEHASRVLSGAAEGSTLAGLQFLLHGDDTAIGLWHAAPGAVNVTQATRCLPPAAAATVSLRRLPRVTRHSDGSFSYWCRADGAVYGLLWCAPCLPLLTVCGVEVLATTGNATVGDAYLFPTRADRLHAAVRGVPLSRVASTCDRAVDMRAPSPPLPPRRQLPPSTPLGAGAPRKTLFTPRR
jgi:hypothetical protein